MTLHQAFELGVRSYVALLMVFGEIGLGWVLVHHSESMIGFFSSGKERFPRLLTRMLVISGWIFLVLGCLSIAMFLILMVVIAIQSFWS